MGILCLPRKNVVIGLQVKVSVAVGGEAGKSGGSYCKDARLS